MSITNSKPLRRNRWDRTPGERVFDRALLSLVLLGLLVAPALNFLRFLLVGEEGLAAPLPAWLRAVPLAHGAVCLGMAGWLARQLVQAWRDPAAKVLRFATAMLLLFLTVAGWGSLASVLR